MKKFLSVKNIIIVILSIIILFNLIKGCGGKKEEKPTDTVKINGKKYDVIKKEIDTFYVEKTKIVKKPGKDIYHDTTIYVSIPQDVDTAKILSQYYAKNIYKDTLKLDDSLGFVSVIDTIKENTIHFRTFTAKVREKIIEQKIYLKEPPKRQLYFGFEGTFDRAEMFRGVGTGVIYKTKSDKIYKANIGVLNLQNDLSPYINAGIYWKIKLKK